MASRKQDSGSRGKSPLVTCLMILGVVTLFAALLVAASPASATVLEDELQAYQSAFEVSDVIARRGLETQHEGAKIVEQLKAAVGDDYAGVWFDGTAGRFVVPVVNVADRGEISSLLDQAGLQNKYRFEVARYTWRELEAGQARIDRGLEEFRAEGDIASGQVQSAINPSANGVALRFDARIQPEEQVAAESVIPEAHVRVQPEKVAAGRLHARPDACDPAYTARVCDLPLRGGWRSGVL